MTRKGPPRDVAASVRQRLLNIAQVARDDFNDVLTRYANERLLYRLSVSEQASRFLLKGATLFAVWTALPHRKTRDVDLLGFGSPDLGALEGAFRAICSIAVEDDGLSFDPATVSAAPIRADQEYGGVRVTLRATLAGARIHLQVDVGFGDAVTPAPVEVRLPTLLEFPTPVLHGYPRETVVAEKVNAMVDLGLANTRMKDFFDLAFLARHFDFDGRLLVASVRATFGRRQTLFPEPLPIALTPVFYDDPTKATQWRAFQRRSGLTSGETLPVVATVIAVFIVPALDAARGGSQWNATWRAGGPWTE